MYGFFGDMFNDYLFSKYARENVVASENINGYDVDTCDTLDEGHETAIKKDEGEWIIVERYVNQEEAAEGHKKWVEFCKGNPKSAYSVQCGKEINFI